MFTPTRLRWSVLAVVIALVLTACGGDETASDFDDPLPDDPVLTVYSGRSEDLIGPLLALFEEETGIDVEVRYGESPELAATILEEGSNSPADAFLAQDPASLGTVALEGLFTPLPVDVVDRVPERFSDPERLWVGLSGRARVVVFDSTVVDPADLPATAEGFTDPEWAGRVGIAPTNGSFLAFVAAKILLDGEDATRTWLQGMAGASQPTFPNNSSIVAAVDEGTVDAGLVNHYYLLRRIDETDGVVAENHFLEGGAGTLVMPSGIGVLATSDDKPAARELVEYLLGEDAQTYFADETFEYPLVPGVPADPRLPAIEGLNTPGIDLSRLAEALDTATDLVAEAGLL